MVARGKVEIVILFRGLQSNCLFQIASYHITTLLCIMGKDLRFAN